MTLGLMSCKDNNEPEIKTVEITQPEATDMAYDANATYAKAEFGIEGMTCAMGCAKSIEKKLAKMEGVKSAKVDFNNQIAMVEYNDEKVTPNSLEEAVAAAGETYKVNNMKTVEEFTVAKLCNKDCCKGIY